MRLRKIKLYGNTYIIPLSKIDINDFGLKEGDLVDVEDMLIVKNNKKIKKEVVEK